MQYLLSHIQSYAFLILLLVTSAEPPVRVLSQLNPSDKAPDFVLPKLESPAESVILQKLNQPDILVFGEAYHQQTLESLVKLKEIVDTLGLTENDLHVFLIVSHSPTEQQLAQLHDKSRISVVVLLDEHLKAFGDYGVTVLPSTVVIDKQGRIDLALSGFPLSFADMVDDAILVATGRITHQQQTSATSEAQQASAQEESVKRAHRLVSLAHQLAARNYTTLALQRYREALELDGTYLQARIGAARCLVKLNLLPDAIEELQKVLQANEDYIEANLILSQINILQGGDGITEGKSRLERILSVNPEQPEANYLMGMVCEAQGEKDHALNYYKKAAKRLIETHTN